MEAFVKPFGNVDDSNSLYVSRDSEGKEASTRVAEERERVSALSDITDESKVTSVSEETS
ncbi:hypothetical protein E2C01_090898 [Portunus trituberculatus]|uniref:Uncharacterized protein n=1 Tax=Portunus trituberculatus TaxID=210409 RepID=A0A5B7JRL2_PORTR|nr:hypothetical protein [Portunus trituberculatus]